MFTVYSKPSCTFCDQAKALLAARGITFNTFELDVGQDKIDGVEYVTKEQLLQIVPGAKSMPQILQDGKPIGGFAELKKVLA